MVINPAIANQTPGSEVEVEVKVKGRAEIIAQAKGYTGAIFDVAGKWLKGGRLASVWAMRDFIHSNALIRLITRRV